MDGAPRDSDLHIDNRVLDRLMPMYLRLNEAGHVVSFGPTFGKLFPQTRLVGRDFFDLIDIRRPGGLTSVHHLRVRAGERFYFTLRGQPSQGFRGIAVPLTEGQGLLLNLSFGIGILDAVRDHGLTNADFAATDLAVELLYLVEAKTAVVDELRKLNLRLQGAKVAAEEQAVTDTLTGLRNRRGLDVTLSQAIGGRAPFGLMHIDLDFFKAVNDTLGHAAGDHVLRAVAGILSDETRAGDTLARVGGDEFVVVLPGLANPVRLQQIAERIIQRLGQPIDFEGQACRISASIGMTISTQYRNPSPERMLNDADLALYACKHAGRGRAQLHAPVGERGEKILPPMRAG